MYHLIVYPPWPGAQQRVIAFYGAAITAEGLVTLGSVRMTDVGAAGDPLEVTGASYTCSARLVNVASWADVQETGDFELVLVPR